MTFIFYLPSYLQLSKLLHSHTLLAYLSDKKVVKRIFFKFSNDRVYQDPVDHGHGVGEGSRLGRVLAAPALGSEVVGR